MKSSSVTLSPNCNAAGFFTMTTEAPHCARTLVSNVHASARGARFATDEGESHEADVLAGRLLDRHPCAVGGDRQAVRGATGQSARGWAVQAGVHFGQSEVESSDAGARRRLGADRVSSHRLLAGTHQSGQEAAAG